MIISDDQLRTKEVREWRGLHLLHFQGSTCSQKVRLMLGELGLEWTSRPVNLLKQANSTPWFLGINPRGVVPVLVHDGVVHVESNDILAYLDSTFSKPGSSYFFERSTTEADEAKALLHLEDSLHMDLRLLTIQFGPLPLKNKKMIEDQEKNGAFDDKRAHEVDWWRDKEAHGISEEETRSSLQAYNAALGELSDRLAQASWLMGDNISIVDIAWFSNLYRLQKVGYPLSRHEHLAEYYQRLIARPAFRKELSHAGSRVGGLVFGMVRLANRLRGKQLTSFL